MSVKAHRTSVGEENAAPLVRPLNSSTDGVWILLFLFFSSWTVIYVQWMRLVGLFSSSCAGIIFFFLSCIFLLPLLVRLCLWFGETSVLESVKLLNLRLCGCSSAFLFFFCSALNFCHQCLSFVFCFRLYSFWFLFVLAFFVPWLFCKSVILPMIKFRLWVVPAHAELCRSNVVFSLCSSSYTYLNMSSMCVHFGGFLFVCLFC